MIPTIDELVRETRLEFPNQLDGTEEQALAIARRAIELTCRSIGHEYGNFSFATPAHIRQLFDTLAASHEADQQQSQLAIAQYKQALTDYQHALLEVTRALQYIIDMTKTFEQLPPLIESIKGLIVG